MQLKLICQKPNSLFCSKCNHFLYLIKIELDILLYNKVNYFHTFIVAYYFMIVAIIKIELVLR